MSQRVNIQYSVELDDLQAEVDRLYKSAVWKLYVTTSNMPHPDHIEFEGPVLLEMGTLEKIDSLRQELAKIDFILSDVSNIIQSYVHFKTQPEQIKNDTLEDKLAMFKEALSENTDQG